MPTIDEALQIGWQQHQAGNFKQAESVYRQVLQVASSNANAWCFLGMVCHDQKRYDEAVAAYQEALRIQPQFPVALSNLGNTLKQQGRLEEAEASCREALRLKPDYSTAYNNLGVALVAQGRLAEAAETFDKALSLMPNDAVAHANLSAALVKQGKYDHAEQNARRALEINPNYAEAHKNQGIVWLLLGDFERGWPEYEWRWRCPGYPMPSYSQPLWDGSPLDGQTILLHHEQGLGDTIQFVRYGAVLKQLGARVIAKVQRPLLKLLATCPDIDLLVSQDTELPKFDVHAPMLSVPGILGTNFDTIPADVPYVSPDDKLVGQWQNRLARYEGFKVGIVWQGSPDFHADAQRSMPLRHFAPLAAIDGVRLISLQKGFGSEQVDGLHGEFEVVHFGDELDDEGAFMDTAAILKCVDLAIVSDTSVAHLAGALAVPTWVALPISPDWRWFLDREDSPWYPTMRLFRQTRLDDWQDVFARLANALGERVGSSPPAVINRQSPSRARILDTGFNCLKLCRHGYLLFNKHDMYIGKSLDEYGEFSEDEIRLFRRILGAGDMAIEAGANLGAHTIALAKLVGPSGRVVAFEPQRLLYQTLCANMALNSLGNVDCHWAAVGGREGETVVPELAPDRETNFGGLGLGEYQRGERRPVVTLDSLHLAGCRLLKIDVEGMEQQVLAGASELIRECRPIMYIENDRQDRSPELIQCVLDAGYRLYWHLPSMFQANNFFGNPDNVFGRVVSVNMLCVPGEQGFASAGLRAIEGPESRWQDAS